jgi:hypothetical protein
MGGCEIKVNVLLNEILAFRLTRFLKVLSVWMSEYLKSQTKIYFLKKSVDVVCFSCGGTLTTLLSFYNRNRLPIAYSFKKM